MYITSYSKIMGDLNAYSSIVFKMSKNKIIMELLLGFA
jgi:hypothetical protein